MKSQAFLVKAVLGSSKGWAPSGGCLNAGGCVRSKADE